MPRMGASFDRSRRATSAEQLRHAGRQGEHVGQHRGARALSQPTGYSFPRAISIFRNLAWRLLILEMWSNAYRIAPNVG